MFIDKLEQAAATLRDVYERYAAHGRTALNVFKLHSIAARIAFLDAHELKSRALEDEIEEATDAYQGPYRLV